MITLPEKPIPNGMVETLLDYNFVQRGAASVQVNRLGSRYSMQFSFPPMKPEEARVFTSRFKRGKRLGIRINLPMLVPQGFPGAPVVDGAGQSGATLNVRGLEPGHVIGEGFWMTLVDSDGIGYLHSVSETAVADANGEAAVEIEPLLRAPFADGATIHLAEPYIEGFVDGENFVVETSSDQFVILSVTVEEYQ